MSSHIDPTVRHDALLLFEVIDSNPNGDPDNGGHPRTDLDSGQGVVSDVSIKRKIRDTVRFQVDQGMLPAAEYDIFIRRGDSLNGLLAENASELDLPAKAKGAKVNKDHEAQLQERMVSRYFDVRVFGALMATGDNSAGKVIGPVSIGIARSLDPVAPMDLAITRVASTHEDKKDNASQMGSKVVVPYGLYAARIHYQPTRDSAMTKQDLEVLWRSMGHMYEVTRSSVRPDVNVRGLFVFSHDNALGNAPAWKLIESVDVHRVDPSDPKPPTSIKDYVITEPTEVPPGVTYTRLV